MERVKKLKLQFGTLVLFMVCNVMGMQETDIVIVGGGAGGTAAAIQAARNGAKVTVLESGPWLGGMLTSAGVSAIDGNHRLPSGIWGEFRDSLYVHYGGPKQVGTGWVSHTLFEPSVAKDIFRNMMCHEKVDVLYNTKVLSITDHGGSWEIVYQKGALRENIKAKILMDGTERGDVLPMVGAGFRLGMDSKSETGEDQAPLKANSMVQDITYVAILEEAKTSKSKKGLVKKPTGYDPSAYECACERQGGEMFGKVTYCKQMLEYGKLPNNKYMINWPNCGNDYFLDWPNLTEVQRQVQVERAKSFTQGFVYYIQQELGFKNLRLSNEFPTRDGFPLMHYDREARRAKAKVFLTVKHLETPYAFNLYRTGIAVGDYPIDHHHDKNPDAPKIDFISIRVPSYNIPLGALIPEGTTNFIAAEKNIGVSNIVNGATRLQPVVLGIGQAAGALAGVAIKEGMDVSQVPVRQVQRALLEDGAYLMPFIDVTKEDTFFGPVQRIGATGILKGHGVPYKWANETWFYPHRMVTAHELWEGLRPWYPELKYLDVSGNPLTLGELANITSHIDPDLDSNAIRRFIRESDLSISKDNGYVLNRKEVSILIDGLLRPFDIPVDHLGNIKPEDF